MPGPNIQSYIVSRLMVHTTVAPNTWISRSTKFPQSPADVAGRGEGGEDESGLDYSKNHNNSDTNRNRRTNRQMFVLPLHTASTGSRTAGGEHFGAALLCQKWKQFRSLRRQRSHVSHRIRDNGSARLREKWNSNMGDDHRMRLQK